MKSKFYLHCVLFVLLVFALGACQEDDFDLDELPNAVFGDGSGDVYQAEDRSNQSGCSQKTNHAGYTGEGFMDYGGNGTWVEWNDVNVAAAGDYTLTFRYANARTSERRAVAIVNGQNKGNVAFAGTGSWTTWKTDTIAVSLRKGLNTIRLQANTGSGGPNLDAMEVSADDLCPGDPNKTEPGDCGCGVPEGDCGVAQGNGLSGTYFNNMDLTGQVLARLDPTVDFNWGNGSPDAKIDSNTFSVRWTGFVEAKYSETYTFYTNSDDGIRLWVDDDLIIDNWTNHPPTENQGTISLQAGERYPIKMEYYENGGGAVAGLLWSSATQGKQIVPGSSLFTDPAGETLCVEAPERSSATLTCPGDEVIDSLNFASYGTPAGTCDTGFALSSCHATSSMTKLEDACLDKKTCTMAASNGVFGDPCSGTFKRLAVVFTCTGDAVDHCPDDPNKTEPGDCGCGKPEGSCEGCTDTLLTDDQLLPGEHICSENGEYEFGLTSGGKLALWSDAETLWSDGTFGSSVLLVMQGDGNLVIYNGTQPRWASNTPNNPGATLKLENDGRAVIRLNGKILWEVGGNQCPDDPDKTKPGACGCNVPEDACNSVTLDRIDGSDLRVGVYNVMRSSVFPLDNGGRENWGDRIDGFERVAGALDADIWAMQELMYDGNDNGGRTPAGLKRHMERITGGNWYMVHNQYYKEFIFSRYPIDAHGSVTRRVLWALIDVGNDNNRQNDVAVITVHFVTDGQGEDCAKLVRDIVAGNHSHIPRDVTLLVVGDFNNKPNGPRYAGVRSAIEIPDLRPVWLGTPDTTFTHGGLTYNGGAFKAPRGGDPIDYIFSRTSDDYAVAKNFILSTLVLDQSVLNAHGLERMDVALDPGQNVSDGVRVNCDHFPLVVDLRSTR